MKNDIEILTTNRRYMTYKFTAKNIKFLHLQFHCFFIDAKNLRNVQ